MTHTIQDFYPERFAHCWGCGRENPQGLHLKSRLDGDGNVATFSPGQEFSGGVAANVYGGFIASLLDCHGTASAAAFAHRERGHALTPDQPPPRFVTGTLTVGYRRPTPMGVELTVRGRLMSHQSRKVTVELELAAADEVCARGEMIAVEISANL